MTDRRKALSGARSPTRCGTSAHEALPRARIAAAAERNYRVASEIQWRKLRLRTAHEQRQLLEETSECTFRPARIAKLRKHAHVQARYRLPAPTKSSATTSSSESAPLASDKVVRTRKDRSEHKSSVFERLYAAPVKPRPETPDPSAKKRVTTEQLAAFVARQAHDAAQRRVRSACASTCTIP